MRIKKFFSAILTGLFLFLCTLCAGCDLLSVPFNQEIEGTYKFSKMTYVEGGMKIEIEAGEEFMGIMTISESFMIATLTNDGIAIMVTNAGVETETLSGTWKKVEEGKIELTFEGETSICACDGKTLTNEEDGGEIILKK